MIFKKIISKIISLYNHLFLQILTILYLKLNIFIIIIYGSIKLSKTQMSQNHVKFIPRYIENSISIGSNFMQSQQNYDASKSKIVNSINLSFEPSMQNTIQAISGSNISKQKLKNTNNTIQNSVSGIKFDQFSLTELIQPDNVSLLKTNQFENSIKQCSPKLLQNSIFYSKKSPQSTLFNSVYTPNPLPDSTSPSPFHPSPQQSPNSSCSTTPVSELSERSLHINSLENPIIQELLPLNLQFDIQEIQLTNQLPQFISVYLKDINRAKLRSLNVLISTLLAIEKSKLEIQFSDLQDSLIATGLNGSIVHQINPFKQHFLQVWKLYFKVQISRKRFVKKIYLDRIQLFVRYAFQQLRKYSNIKRQFSKIDICFYGTKFIENLKFEVSVKRKKEQEIRVKLANSIFGTSPQVMENSVFIGNATIQSVYNDKNDKIQKQFSKKFLCDFLVKLQVESVVQFKYNDNIDLMVSSRYDDQLVTNVFNLLKDSISKRFLINFEGQFHKVRIFKQLIQVFNKIKVFQSYADNFKDITIAQKILKLLLNEVQCRRDRKERFIVLSVQKLCLKTAFSSISLVTQEVHRLKKIEVQINQKYFYTVKFNIFYNMKLQIQVQKYNKKYQLRLKQLTFNVLVQQVPRQKLLKSVIDQALTRYKTLIVKNQIEQSSVFKYSLKQKHFFAWKITIKQEKIESKNNILACQFSEFKLMKHSFYTTINQFQILQIGEQKISLSRSIKLLTVMRNQNKLMKDRFSTLNNWADKFLEVRNDPKKIQINVFGQFKNVFTAIKYSKKILQNKVIRTILKYSCSIKHFQKIQQMQKVVTLKQTFYYIKKGIASAKYHKNLLIKNSIFGLKIGNRNLMENYEIAETHLNDTLIQKTFKMLRKEKSLNDLYETSLQQGVTSFRKYYFKKWLVFYFSKRKVYFLHVKCLQYQQQKIKMWANEVNVCKKQSSILARIGVHSSIQMLQKSGISCNNTVQTAIVVQDFKNMLKAFLTWRWRLRQIRKWEMHR
ncbi:hypothetical protein SS50377_28243 [Spironucleus salmonicida]|uniref:Uncharacterized protein n=1 Tax=Spironucleus salmonicida TaxID=348837 RepID=V6M4Y8_9EUKA|nr:hypothetical protein SS50377_28243 [Spironucleus salmonicida]|eukprot:EST48424.1 Hypothetical protein SS50377_11372 [Spironucleus salmonicida]